MTLPIKGFLPHSFLDWEENIASVVFLGGCTMRCCYCHSSLLATEPDRLQTIEEEAILQFLKQKKMWLDGIVITGGEPLMHMGLPAFLRQVKNMGLPIKLDTNGSFPERLHALLSQQLLDYVAMDIKAPLRPGAYHTVTSSTVSITTLKRSIAFIMQSPVPYEFRITCSKHWLSGMDIVAIARHIRGAQRLRLQHFKRPPHPLPNAALDETQNFSQI